MKVNEGVADTVNKLRATKDYLTGKHTNALGNLISATDEEIKSNDTLAKLTKSFDKVKSKYDVQIDPRSKKLRMTFDSRKVPTELVDDFKSDGKYDKLVNSYDPKSYEVEMIFDVEKNIPTNNTNRSNSTTATADNANDSTAEESVMVPTPTPYKYKPAVPPEEDDDGLTITEDLTMTEVEPYQDDSADDIGLRTTINGRKYNFRMKDDSPYTVDQMFSKVNKMMTFSKGKALAFLKKNAVGVRAESALREGNPFKSSFVCQGCGKTLDQCTCDLPDVDDEDEETQTEGVLILKKPYETPVIYQTESLISQDMLRNHHNERRRQMTDEEYDEWIREMKKALATPDEDQSESIMTLNTDEVGDPENVLILNTDNQTDDVSVWNLPSSVIGDDMKLIRSSDLDEDLSHEGDVLILDTDNLGVTHHGSSGFKIVNACRSEKDPEYNDVGNGIYLSDLRQAFEDDSLTYQRHPVGEAFDALATQPSSIGQHKRDDIDLIELGGEESDG